MKYKQFWVLSILLGLLVGIESAALASPWYLESNNRTIAQAEQKAQQARMLLTAGLLLLPALLLLLLTRP